MITEKMIAEKPSARLSARLSAGAIAADPRLEQIQYWVKNDLSISNSQLETASADASFRRYFRLLSGSSSWVIMDAPPEKEDCLSFVKVARLIEAAGVHAPHIYSFNEAQGFMQLSDLGSIAFLDELVRSESAEDRQASADILYTDAIKALLKMQSIQAELPAYNAKLLQTEMALFKDWYLDRHLHLPLDNNQQKVLENVFNALTESALRQSTVFVHRDYHSRNLMVTANNNPGVIDFQDALNGPVSYDLVSLIKDCYIAWPRNRQLQWIDQYLALSTIAVNREVFIRQFDLMGLQRHLKAIGIFARLKHRDGKPGYLKDIPRTLAYVFDVCSRYEELGEFVKLLTDLGLCAEPELLAAIQ